MPTGRKYSKTTGRWEKVEKTTAFDYANTNYESGALLLSFFRTFPDLFLDVIESDNADFTLALPQRVMLRGFAHYGVAFYTSFRGLGKTYCVVLSDMVDGFLYPGEVVRYYAPSKQMGAELAAVAFHQIERNYPLLAQAWKIRSETKESFIIVTDAGSEIAVGAIQGGNCSQITVEEIGQETEPKFDFAEYESKVIPTCRMSRKIKKIRDIMHINPHFKYITNASRRINPTYSKYRADAYKKMALQPYGSGFCMDISWEMGVLFGIRSQAYVENLKMTMTKEDFLRQMCACYTGTAQNPMISDEDLSASRRLKCMETKHCGDPDVIYIIAHDVSYENGTANAKCATVVVKLSAFDADRAKVKRDKYRKEVVYLDNYPPPPDASIQAQKLRDLWERFTIEGANPTYIAIDAWQYGRSVLEALVKPSEDGVNLACYQHVEDTIRPLEQNNALEIIYPVKAGGSGTRDPDFEMLKYARVEFEQGNISLLTGDLAEGLEQYKRRNGIKGDEADISILQPYYHTNELCEQIQNLRVVASGTGEREQRISQSIQRDDWSALKYALRVADGICERNLALENATEESSWAETIKALQNQRTIYDSRKKDNPVNRLLRLRKW